LDELKETFASAIRGLDHSGVRYAVIGGISAIIRGSIRVTRDFDVLALASTVDLDRLAGALEQEGFHAQEGAAPITLGDVTLSRFWKSHDKVFIDVGLDVQVSASELCGSVVERATREHYLGTEMPVATSEDVILLKLVAFRPLDRSDAITIVQNALAPLDWPYLDEWAARIDVRERLEEVRQAAG
jgi:hypothetical protein